MPSTSNRHVSDRGTKAQVRPGARLTVAVLVSAAIVLAAPFLGQLRGLLRSAFPGYFAAIVGGTVAIAVFVALGVALVRVRERRGIRYSAIAVSLFIAVIYSLATRTGIPEVDSVERVNFVEYGAIAFLFYRAWRRLGNPSMLILPALAALLVGTLDEWLQWFIPNRVGEARDVFLNLVAIACGLLFGTALEPPATFTGKMSPASRRLVSTAAITMIAVFAAFVGSVHGGHLVADQGIGSFKSHYTAHELRQLSADRTARWAADPPAVLKRLSREDQYLDEGLWHLRERNERFAAGEYDVALLENAILESYFAPVIDTKIYAVPEISRWPAEQKADAQQRAAKRLSFVSEAEPYPILTTSKAWFWGIVLALVFAVALWGRIGSHRSSRAQEK